MKKKPYFYYLIHIQFLGFRYHGWMKQPGVKTIQGTIDKTLAFILEEQDFKTLGAGRTDARVSANEGALELFVREPLVPETLLELLNLNLPSDIRALGIEEVDQSFNIIQTPKNKEYIYLFSHGEKNHPFCAPFMVYMQEALDIALMKKGAKLFEGTHHFSSYCYKPNKQTELVREITRSEIRENDLYTASFFPEKSYVYQVEGKGFLRHQVRLMMGTLFALGKGAISLEDIRASLQGSFTAPLAHMAPQYGLILNKLSFEG
jgi:tRNA pseudouridine38-40 synthase